MTYPKLFKGCKFAEAAKRPSRPASNKASLGKGIVRNHPARRARASHRRRYRATSGCGSTT